MIQITQLCHLINEFPNSMNLTIFSPFQVLIIQINLIIQLGFFPKIYQSIPNILKYQYLEQNLYNGVGNPYLRENNPNGEDRDESPNTNVLQIAKCSD